MNIKNNDVKNIGLIRLLIPMDFKIIIQNLIPKIV